MLLEQVEDLVFRLVHQVLWDQILAGLRLLSDRFVRRPSHNQLLDDADRNTFVVVSDLHDRLV